MLSNKLTEIKLADLKKSISFFRKTNIFKNHSQQKLSTKRVGSFSCNYLEKQFRLFLMRLNHKTIK